MRCELSLTSISKSGCVGTHGGARPSRETRAECSAVPAEGLQAGAGTQWGCGPIRNGGPRRGGHARQRRGETGEEVWWQVRGREAPSWGVGGLRPGARPRFPSARVPESSRILPEPISDRPESSQNPLGARPRSSLEPARDAPRSPPGIPLELVPVPVRPARHRTSPLESARVRLALPARRRAHRRGRTRPGAGSRAPIRSRPPSPRSA